MKSTNPRFTSLAARYTFSKAARLMRGLRHARTFHRLGAIVLATHLLAASALAKAGDLDTTFGTGGTVLTDFAATNDRASKVAVQPDGNIVVVGSTAVGSASDFALVRYTAAGLPDPTFGIGGKVITDFGGDSEARAVALQTDGKILVAGNADTGTRDVALARYNSDGSLDLMFGAGGKVTTSFGSIFSTANDVAIQADGKIVIVGRVDDDPAFGDDSLLARYMDDGSPDPAFGTGGMVATSFGVSEEMVAVAIQPDGRVVTGGWAVQPVGNDFQDFVTARFEDNGDPDPTFGSGGVVITPIGTDDDIIFDIALQDDGKIVAAGVAEGPESFALVRYDDEGNPDPSFGTAGIVTTSINGIIDIAAAVAIQSDGRIVAAGFTRLPADVDFAVARYLTDGSPDCSFGNAGIVVTPIGTDIVNSALAADLQADGKIVVAGVYDPSGQNAAGDFAVARYLVEDLPPELSCPEDFMNPTDAGQCSAAVSYTVTVDDECAGVTVECDPTSGSTFEEGDTVVNCSATDPAGQTSTCSFTVTVEDAEPPVVNCSVATPALWPPDHSLANVGLEANATDNCDSNPAISVNVFGDEDDLSQPGDGVHSPDAKDLELDTLRLRRERNAGGDGRVYLVAAMAADAAGNGAAACCTVNVPRDQSKASLASVEMQAEAAESYCTANNGSTPLGYVVIGDGPIMGPNQ